MPAGINKPFDRILKSFADEAPALLLRLLGFVPTGVEPDIKQLRPETAPAVVLPDFVALVRLVNRTPFIFHAEFQTNYYAEAPSDIAHYGGSLAGQYLIPVKSVLVMLRPKGVPAEIPELGDFAVGDTHTLHPFRVVRLWELDPTPVLETNNPRLLPWALLMKSTDAQIREIVSSLLKDEEALGRFVILGSIRYDRDTLDEMLGGAKMGLVRAILDASSLVQEEREIAAAKGKVEGQQEGREQRARMLLRRVLRRNFPELESMPEVDQITGFETLQSLLDKILDAHDNQTVRSAIVAAARPH